MENNIKPIKTVDKVTGKLKYIEPERYYSVIKNPKPKQKAKNLWEPEYDLIEVSKLRDIETYFSRSIRKKLDVIFKEGFELYVKSPKIQKKLFEKLAEMEFVSGKPFDLLIYQIVENFIVFDNVFIAKIRDKKSTSFKAPKGYKKKRNPIAAFKILPTEYVNIGTDDNGYITKYQVVVNNNVIEEYDPADIIHITRNKKSGYLFGTPEVTPVVGDILELRRIEENVTQTIYRMATPLVVVTVGTENNPAKVIDANGTTELDLAKQIIENAEPGSALIFPERYKLDVIGSKSEAMNVSDYLDHFKKRIFAGLSMSAYDFGETDSANRGSAAGLSKDFIDYCKGIQQYINIYIKLIFREIVAEFTNLTRAYEKDNTVYIKWTEIDPDRKTKNENATVQLFASNIITIEEAREKIGYEKEFDESLLFTNLTSKERITSESAVNESESKTNPKNQHTKDNNKSVLLDIIKSNRNNFYDVYELLNNEKYYYNIINKLKDEYNIKLEQAKDIISTSLIDSLEYDEFLRNVVFDKFINLKIKNLKGE